MMEMERPPEGGITESSARDLPPAETPAGAPAGQSELPGSTAPARS